MFNKEPPIVEAMNQGGGGGSTEVDNWRERRRMENICQMGVLGMRLGQCNRGD